MLGHVWCARKHVMQRTTKSWVMASCSGDHASGTATPASPHSHGYQLKLRERAGMWQAKAAAAAAGGAPRRSAWNTAEYWAATCSRKRAYTLTVSGVGHSCTRPPPSLAASTRTPAQLYPRAVVDSEYMHGRHEQSPRLISTHWGLDRAMHAACARTACRRWLCMDRADWNRSCCAGYQFARLRVGASDVRQAAAPRMGSQTRIARSSTRGNDHIVTAACSRICPQVSLTHSLTRARTLLKFKCTRSSCAVSVTWRPRRASAADAVQRQLRARGCGHKERL